jgi:formate--tetrahydrofolate ligase
MKLGDNMKSDIDISYDTKLIPIKNIASKLNIAEDDLEYYGKYKAKINLKYQDFDNKDGKLILVTSMNPTPFGEGKTTMSIGITDALNYIDKKATVVLREPSLGPVFGIKGGATGGGYSQVVPMEDINLHFTGDMHAITAANNLLSAIIDNHIYQGNELHIKEVIFPRCMDMNDRALRNVKVGIGYNERDDHFVITVASEIMAILCLATGLEDLKKRISNIMFGYDESGKALYVKDLKAQDAMTLLLKDAIKPNLVQTLEGNPAIIHGGPFANIAHGCNSVIATKLALKLSDYVVTEAGFGADLGAEKFMDIKCRLNNLKPDCVVVNATIRAIKHNGGCPKEDLTKESTEYLKKGLPNLLTHVENMKKYTDNVIICVNNFYTDTENEYKYVENYFKDICEVKLSTTFKDGGVGALDLARSIVKICDHKTKFNLIYKDDDALLTKIEKVAKEIYRADGLDISDEVKDKLKSYEDMGYKKCPVCIAKTQYSLSDNAKLLGKPKHFKINVKDVKLCSGAGFIVVYTGSIMTMPGLSKTPAYLGMTIDNNGKISGLY